MDYKQSSKGFFSPCSALFPTPTSSLASSLKVSLLKGSVSVGSDSILHIPSCVNHRKRKSSYIVHLQEKQTIYFCQRCMEMASQQGFKGLMITEFHRSYNVHRANPMQQEKDKSNRTGILSRYLDDLKLFYQQVGNFREKIQDALKQDLNSNYISALLQRFQKQIQQLRSVFDRETFLTQQKHSKIYQEILCKISWSQEDLEHMISRICKNYDKLLGDSLDKFSINVNIMNQTLEEKKKHLEKMKNQFETWKTDYKIDECSLNQKFYIKLKKLCNDCLLDTSISNISPAQSLGKQNSLNFCQIIQQLSTNNTLA